MARLPTLASRPTPRRKTETALPTQGRQAHQQVTKAAKRAAKRAQLSKEEASGPTSSLREVPTISKSALRRRKRKARDEVVLGKDGMGEMMDELEDLEGDEAEEDAGSEDGLGAALASEAVPQAPTRATAGRTQQRDAKVGSKMRKRVLAQEQLRQPHILRDLQASSKAGAGDTTKPAGLGSFAAIRQHAQNSMGLRAPTTSASNSSKGKWTAGQDELMT